MRDLLKNKWMKRVPIFVLFVIVALICFVRFDSPYEVKAASYKDTEVYLDNQMTYNSASYGDENGIRPLSWQSHTFYVIDDNDTSGFVRVSSTKGGSAFFWIPVSYIGPKIVPGNKSGTFAHSDDHYDDWTFGGYTSMGATFSIKTVKSDSPSNYSFTQQERYQNYNAVFTAAGLVGTQAQNGYCEMDGQCSPYKSFSWLISPSGGWVVDFARVLMYECYDLDTLRHSVPDDDVRNLYITYKGTGSTILTYWELDASGNLVWDSGWYKSDGLIYKIQSPNTRYVLVYFKNVGDGQTDVASGWLTPIQAGEISQATVAFWGPTVTFYAGTGASFKNGDSSWKYCYRQSGSGEKAYNSVSASGIDGEDVHEVNTSAYNDLGPTKYGYHFTGWSGGLAANAAPSASHYANEATFTAQWAANQ